MNRARVVALLRELLAEFEAADEPANDAPRKSPNDLVKRRVPTAKDHEIASRIIQRAGIRRPL